jgi:putative membrane protein
MVKIQTYDFSPRLPSTVSTGCYFASCRSRLEKEDFNMQNCSIPKGACFLTLLAVARVVCAASLNNADKQFMIAAARTDMVEAHEGQMAETQAKRADVKDFAKTLVQDHTQSYEQLTALAVKTGISIPKGINAAKDPAIAPLIRLNGDRFDREFDRDEVAAHRRALASFKHEAASGHDPDVKAWAAQRIPVLEKHLRLAEECAKPVKRT